MKSIYWLLVILSIVVAVLSIQSYLSKNTQKFHNTEIRYETGLSNIWQMVKAYWTTERAAPEPTVAMPIMPITAAALALSQDDAIYRLGHSTLLIRIDNQYILIDPVFSERASPVQWAGPKRFHAPPISIADLPPIKVVILSHDHYDHLDQAAIEALKDKVEHFVTPLKVGQYLTKWGVDSHKVTELDWWQQIEIDGLTLVATPSQHFSGRGLFDKDQTLWASWVIQGQQHKLFFSGDSGYFNGFKEIGERYGPFDISMIETGAYNSLWREIHMHPEESLQAHIDVKAKAMMPVHNGTFDLALHDWFDPFEQISVLAQQQNVTLLTPQFGEAVMLANPQASEAWWREMMQKSQL